MSRLSLRLQAFFFRTLAFIWASCDRYLSTPIPRRPSFTRTIPSSDSKTPGSIKLLFYTPKSYSHPQSSQSSRTNSANQSPWKGYPVLVNFHGGGFTIGLASDDDRWAGWVTEQGYSYKNAVVVSVAYRLAPEYPFPTAIEDCISAINWIWDNGPSLGLDVSRTAISGFSAGGQLSLTVTIELARLQKAAPHKDGRLVGVVSFYPSADWTRNREQRDASNKNLIRPIPPLLFRIMDESYLYPVPEDMTDPRLSPGLASDQVLREAFPDMILINCGGDQLLAETEVFRKRMKGLGKSIEGYTVDGVPHAWDKKPSFRKGNESRDRAYGYAVKGLHRIWGIEDKTQ